ncbi:MAG TPA: outer membrane beta-barrel protein [Gammaproteobacteria bacterium]
MRPLLAVLTLMPAAVLAQETGVSYNYFGLGYSRIEVEDDVLNDSFDFVGYNVEGSVTVRDHFHLFGFITDGSDDEPGMNLDTLDIVAGVGTHFDPLERFSVFGRVGLVKSEADNGIDSLDDDGYYLEAGLRYMPVEWVEVRAGLSDVEFDDIDVEDGEAALFGADLYLTEVVALTLDYTKQDNADAVTLGVRFYPGKEIVRGRRW